MKILEVKSLVIPDVKVIRFGKFPDERGYFTEPFRSSDLRKVIPDFSIQQVNESYSKKNTVRGLHLQWNPYMGKLVRTVRGHMVDMFLDLRKGSPTFGKAAAYDMPTDPSKEYNEWIWLPIGFAHGNFYMEDTTIEYFCTSEYSPGNEAGISPLSSDIDWSLCDPSLKTKLDGIVKVGALISEKDKQGLTVKEWNGDPRSNNFVYL